MVEYKFGECNLSLSDKICLVINEGNPKKKFLLYFIITMALLIFLCPIVVFIILASIGEGVPFGFFITCVISTLVSGYLMRLYLWNKYGKETFILEKNSLSLSRDYKYYNISVH